MSINEAVLNKVEAEQLRPRSRSETHGESVSIHSPLPRTNSDTVGPQKLVVAISDVDLDSAGNKKGYSRTPPPSFKIR